MSDAMMGVHALHGLVGGRGPDGEGFVVVAPRHDGFFSVSSEAGDPFGLAFSDDGTRMFVADRLDEDVHQYTLSTAWDVTSASHDGFFSVSSEATSPQGLAFSDDGTRMFVVDMLDKDVHQYTLSTAWDVTTASHDGFFSVSSEASSPRDVAFSDDGTRMFVVDSADDDVHQYTLSTAWDVTSATHDGFFSVSSEAGSPFGVAFSADGSRMFVTDFPDEDVHQYTLSTAWDVTTASHDGFFSVSSEASEPFGLAFSDDGTRMFVTDFSGEDVHQWQLPLVTYPE